MPLYTGDYLRDTSELSPREHGAYLLMLMWCWQRYKPLPPDIVRIYRIVKAKDEADEAAVRYVLGEFFKLDDDGYHNKRIEDELHRSNGLSERGKAGARARWGKPKVNGHDASPMQDGCLPDAKGMDPTPIPIPTTIPKPRTKPTTKVKSLADGQAVGPETAATWEAYATAYKRVYGVEPVRNARVNAQILGFVKRVGAAESPAIAAFYLTHRRGLYVSSKHATDLLLRDAEGLRTEWATGRKVTDTAARQGDRTQALGDAFAPLIEAAEARDRERKP